MHLITTLLLLFTLLTLAHSLTTSVIPITKDDQTNLHKVTWDGEPDLLVDLDAPFLWKDCIIRHSEIPCGLEEGCRFPMRCDTKLCIEAKSYINPVCPNLNITDKYKCNICSVTPLNPVSNVCKISQLTTDLIDIYLTDGRHTFPGPNRPFGSRFVVSCAPKNLLLSFPKDVSGVAAFSWSGLAFPRQLSFLNVTAKFGLCLPSSSTSLGVVFLGEGPFYFTKNPNLDLRSILSYTPLYRTSSKELGYHVKLNRISVKGLALSLPSLKSGYVKLSTRVPYTVLRTDVYKALVASFDKATSGIARVSSVKPFGFCLKDGGAVPKIDFEMESGKVWSVSSANSMKRVGNGGACLAFVDGGAKAKDVVVIGTHQMEDNFLLFDLVNKKLGFSSSLLGRGTSCGGFNFTQVGN